MKRILLVFCLLFAGTLAIGQKYAYVNSQVILDKMPEFKLGQQKLDEMAAGWQKDAEAKRAEIAKMEAAYQKEKILLPDDMKIKREEEINQKKKDLDAFLNSKFGMNGELFTKRQEMLKPIQEKIHKAIQDVAEAGGYAFVFDKANSGFIMYADPKNDKTEAVIKKLGL